MRTFEIVDAIRERQVPQGYEFNEPESIEDAIIRIDEAKGKVGEIISQLSAFKKVSTAVQEGHRGRAWRNALVRQQKLFELDLVLLKDFVKKKSLQLVPDQPDGDKYEVIRLTQRMLRAERAKITDPEDPTCLLRALHHHIIEAEIACGQELLKGDGKSVKDMVGQFLRRLDHHNSKLDTDIESKTS